MRAGVAHPTIPGHLADLGWSARRPRNGLQVSTPILLGVRQTDGLREDRQFIFIEQQCIGEEPMIDPAADHGCSPADAQ